MTRYERRCGSSRDKTGSRAVSAGCLQCNRRPRAERSELRARIDLADDAWRGFDLQFRVWPQGAPRLGVRAATFFSLRGPGPHELRLRIGEEQGLWIELDGRRLPSVPGGSHWGGGLWMATRDHARFGLLMQREGQWGSRRLLDAAWIAEIWVRMSMQ